MIVRDVALPGDTTRFDYQSIDPAGRRLYIAHLGDSTIDVIDLDTLTLVRTISGVEQVHGVEFASRIGRLFATATESNDLVMIDPANGRQVARTPTGAFPDGVAYDPDANMVFVSDKNDGSITAVDASSGRALHTVKLGNEVGNVAYNAQSRMLYAAVRSPDQLIAVDPTTLKPTSRVLLPGCDGAHGVYLIPTADRAFVACERNARLATVDLQADREVATTSVGNDPDVLAYDSGLHRLYVASESGTVSVFDTAPAVARKVGEAHLADGAHSVAVDPLTHRVFFPLEDVGGRPVLRVMRPVSR